MGAAYRNRLISWPILASFDATKCKYADHSVDVVLHKGLLGVGLSLEGGLQSPIGDRPLTVKRVFAGQ